jgi:hypothetical protein
MYMIIYEEYVVKAICKNVYVCLGVLDDFIAIRIALSFARRMLWYLSSFSDIWVLMLGLYMRDLAMVPTIGPLESVFGSGVCVKEPTK